MYLVLDILTDPDRVTIKRVTFWGKICNLFRSHKGQNFLGYKFPCSFAVSVMDVEQGTQCLYTVVFSMEAFCGVGKVALISVYFFFCKNLFS